MAKVGRKPGQTGKVQPQTAKKRAIVLSLHGKGLSSGEISTKTGVPSSTVRYWVKTAETSPVRAVPPTVAREAERLAGEPAETLNTDGLDVAELDAEIRDVSGMIDDWKKSTADNAVMNYVRLIGVKRELIVARVKARPVRPPDPNDDPANVGARDLVRARLLLEIEAVEFKNPKARAM